MADAIEDAIAQTMRLTDKELLELGHAAANMVTLRTKQGLDADLKPFTPYSKEYAEQRAKKGYSRRPDLTRTGHMLNAMAPRLTSPGEVTVGFLAATEAMKAAAHNFGSKEKGFPPREFMDVRDPKELSALAEMIGKDITLRVEKTLKK